ncbi:hypothetical protein MMC30_006540 [Trapelia coarctata]|nr:hypothetical protein [Trapelia coarctata]
MPDSPKAKALLTEYVEQVTPEGGGITAAHIQRLIDTNNALRESVISIAALLQEQGTNGNAYPRRTDSVGDLRDWSRSRKDSRDDMTGPLMPGARTDRNSRRRRYEIEWQEIDPLSEEAIELERIKRRKAYEDRWDQSTLDAESGKLVDLYPTILSYDDPWWDMVSCTLRDVSMVDQPQSRKFDTALRSGLRYDLFIALFGSEFNYKWCNASRASFEDSRRFRLGQAIRKLQDSGAVTYFGATFASVLIEVAEWTKKVWTRRPEGSQTLKDLRIHCYRRRVLAQPDKSDYRSMEQQNEGLLAILYALDLRKWWTNAGSWRRIVSDLDTDNLPLETLISKVDEMTGWTGKLKSRIHTPEPSKDMNVDPSDLNSRAIRDLGDIQITWTPELDMHLRLSLDGKRLYVYQYPTWLIGRRFNNPTFHHGDPGDAGDSNKIFHDLAETYALLFGPTNVREASQLLKVLKNTECNAEFLGVPIWRSGSASDMSGFEGVQLDPEHPPAKYFLDNFRSVHLPFSMEPPEGVNAKKGTMADVLHWGPPYHDDMTIMMLSIIRYYPLSGSFNWSGSHFEEQLRMLKAYMDGKKPRTIGQLWKDARDATSWWTFWAVLFFGVASIVLALASLIVGILQTYATFKALHE